MDNIVKNIKRAVYLMLLLMLTTSCSAVDIRMYADNTPHLDLFSYFDGQTVGWGIVQDRKGVVNRYFKVDIHGTRLDENTLRLDEHFSWNDGEKTKRTWMLNREGEHDLSGTAGDVVGEASGRMYGNAMNWQYILNLEVEESNWKIRFDDWMFLVEENVLINRAAMTKFGIRVGEVTIFFKKDNASKDETKGGT